MPLEELFDKLPRDWDYLTLGDACRRGGGDIQTGPFGSQLHASDYVPDGIPSIMPQNIGDNRVVEDGIARITPEDASRLSRYRVRKGDIVYSRRGDVEKRALIREHEDGWLCGTGCLRVRLGEKGADAAYASYYLGHPAVREWIVRHAHGATMPNLNTSILSALPFVLPSHSEQRKIASMLSALDDKIELNRRMNETLEALAQALFKSWFVDATQNELPEGWRIDKLDNVAHFLNGLALQKFPPDGENSLPVIKIAQLRAGNTNGADWAGSNVPPEYVIEDGDVLFSWSGSLEVELWCGGRGALNQHLFKVTSANFPKWFYFLWARYHLPVFQAIAAGKATTMGHIQRRHLSEAEVFIPTDTELEKMNRQMSPIIEKMIVNNLESRSLAQVRDALLPRLLSGTIRIGTEVTRS